MLILVNLILINQIKLKQESMFDLSFENYEKNFIFVVNNKKFSTSRIIADILSPKINNLHLTEPSANKFTITTQIPGNFSCFLQLINFNFNDIPESEIPFINEVATILDNRFIEIQNEEDQENLTIDNVLEKIQKHQKFSKVYSKQIEKEIDFISTHFYLLNYTHESMLYSLEKYVLDELFNHTNLTLRDEDQLLNIVNNLYDNNSNYSYMYEYVMFDYVSNDAISSFLQIYNYNDLTQKVWQSISSRIGTRENQPIVDSRRKYRKLFSYEQGKEFKGIINYLKTNSKNIDAELEIAASSVRGFEEPKSIIYSERDEFFETCERRDQWIYIKFKNHSIIPTYYTMRYKRMNSWLVEGSNNGKDWFLIEKQKGPDGPHGSIHKSAFKIETEKEMKYFRIRQTEYDTIEISAIEIFGFLI